MASVFHGMDTHPVQYCTRCGSRCEGSYLIVNGQVYCALCPSRQERMLEDVIRDIVRQEIVRSNPEGRVC